MLLTVKPEQLETVSIGLHCNPSHKERHKYFGQGTIPQGDFYADVNLEKREQ